jgi:uncharacterized protein YneR
MKRIRSFKLFESVEDNSELVSVIKDMSLELTDKGFYFSKFVPFSYHKSSDRLSFILNNGKVFYFSDIKDVVEDMIAFMKSEGWSHQVEFIFYDGYDMECGDIDGYVKDGELYYYSEHNIEEVVDRNCGLENFILIFTKEVVK